MDGAANGDSGAGAAEQAARWRRDAARAFQYYLDRSTPHATGRWVGTLCVAAIYALRVYLVQGFYIVSYGLGIYLLNLLIGFLSPMVDPELDPSASADGPSLPTRGSDEFKPFIRRLPEFKFWYAITKAFVIAFLMTFFSVFDVPVFWPILLCYWIVLFCPHDETPDYAHDQIQICAVQCREAEVWWKEGWCKQQFIERLMLLLPQLKREMEGKGIRSMLFHVLNSKCNTSFISRIRRIFASVSDLVTVFNSILC